MDRWWLRRHLIQGLRFERISGAFSGGIPRLKTGTWGTRLLKDIEVRGNPTLDANRAFRMGHPRFFLR